MKVVIIFNPNSTGDSAANAKKLAQELKQANVEVSMQETTHAGHGEEIAKHYAARDAKVILISSSGDGGYNEVINGALAHPTKNFVVGVLPSGNANDHHASIGSDSLAKSITHQKFSCIDTIKVTATVDGKPWTRFAHSYVGIGVTARAADRLTKERPTKFTEKFIVLRALLSFRYVKLIEHGKTKRYSSLLFGNTDRMSKVITFAEHASVNDGKFEVSAIRFRSKLRLIAYLLSAALIGLKQTPSVKSFKCKTTARTPIQLDGEAFTIDADSKVRVESVRGSLRCVV